jgi:hypothetical protein
MIEKLLQSTLISIEPPSSSPSPLIPGLSLLSFSFSSSPLLSNLLSNRKKKTERERREGEEERDGEGGKGRA